MNDRFSTPAAEVEEVREVQRAELLSYAPPGEGSGAGRAITGFALIFGGLGLIFLGGCFLIGVMIIEFNAVQLDFATGRSQGLTGGQMLLTGVLYLVAFTCFAGAGYVFWLAIRHLLRSGSH